MSNGNVKRVSMVTYRSLVGAVRQTSTSTRRNKGQSETTNRLNQTNLTVSFLKFISPIDPCRS